jgi:hypothetical protein
MTDQCIACGTTQDVVPDDHGFYWCGQCWFVLRVQVARGFAELGRYLEVKARRRSVAERVREYTEEDGA